MKNVRPDGMEGQKKLQKIQICTRFTQVFLFFHAWKNFAVPLYLVTATALNGRVPANDAEKRWRSQLG
jgi:hypothetical protein